MVLFFGHRILHRVLPFFAPEGAARCMLTLWFHGKSLDEEEIALSSILDKNLSLAPSKADLQPGTPEYWMDLLQKPSVQRLLCKPIYNEEWAKSYKQV